MNKHSIARILQGELAPDSSVIIKGWVRTRHTSKAGISFIALHDGSCFDAIQIVVPESLANYESEVGHLSAGCSIIASGKLVEFEGQNAV